MPEGDRFDAPGATLAVDVGGTFTDAIVTNLGRVFSAKALTTPSDQSAGVMAAAQAAMTRALIDPSAVSSFVHGMTVTTNAVLEGRFARTALLATDGFTDLEELGRQDRPSLYRLCEGRPSPIVPRRLRFAIRERCGPDGVIEPLDETSVRAALAGCEKAEVESIAVCLLFSFRHRDHELRVRELAAELLPGIHVSLSHEVVGTFREFERCATTIADAAMTPLLASYLGRLIDRAREAGLPDPEVMLSNGGTIAAEIAARSAAATILSGPAGGAVGAAHAASNAGAVRALAFDMGGTSTDVCVVTDGRVNVTASREVGGRPVALPTVDIFTVGAGGGSVAWRDAGGALRVGPRSAGAQPGPACYGRGGTEPTVTDANLMLGYLGAESELAGGLRLDDDAARCAIGELGSSLGLSEIETATGIIEIANLEMLRATGAMTIARGVDPRDHVLVAFGGAGPMHGAAVAAALGIDQVVCPATCGVLSAHGMALAGRRRDRSLSIVIALDVLESESLKAIVAELAASARSELGDTADARTSVTFELRFRGQSFELAVEAAGDASPATLDRLFRNAHVARFGFADDNAPIELVTVRVSAECPSSIVEDASLLNEPIRCGASTAESTRTAWFDGAARETRVLRGAMTDGATVAGPAILELPEATVVVPPSWSATTMIGGGSELRRGSTVE